MMMIKRKILSFLNKKLVPGFALGLFGARRTGKTVLMHQVIEEVGGKSLSIFEDGVWSAPANFGPKINTEYDEYRPIIFSFEEVQKNLMIFSSDRPGGLGGFDLYMVKADGYIQN